jgi:iron complex outermembrane recepter protein
MRKMLCILMFGAMCGMLHAIAIQNKGPVIKGRVSDINGSPLQGASVTIENSFLGVHTDAQGDFKLAAEKSGSYKLRISFVGYEPQIHDLILKGDTVLNIALVPGSVLTEEVLVNATRAGIHTPAAYTTVTKEDISKNNIARDIPYLLQYTPSLVVSSDAGTGVGYTNINIRGSDVERINVTIDGIPVNDAESHGVWWVDLPDLASSADNIQIQRGVGTSTNGAGAFGATINFQTTTLNREPYAEINSSYGSFNTSKNTINFGTGLIDKKFAVDARLSKIWSDGYIDRAFSDLKSFYISGTMYGEKSILKLVIFSGVEHTYQAWDGVPKDSLLTHRTYNSHVYKNETDNYWQDNYQLHFSKEISNNLGINAALHYTHGQGYYENLMQDSKFSSFNLPDAIFNQDTLKSSDFVVQKWLRNDFYGFTYSLNYKSGKLNTILGGGWNQYLGKHFGDIIWAKTVTFDGQSYQWYHGTGNKKDLNTFLKTNYSFSDKLNISADLQIRIINYSIGGFDDNLRDVTQTHNYSFFNPKAGFIYNLNPAQKFYASFGVAQREPDRGNFTDADPGKTPVPEKLYDYEAGYEFHTARLLFRGNLYYMYYHDQLILTGEINDVGSSILTNVPRSYREGLELETGIKLLDNLKWNANITFSKNIIPLFTDLTDNWDTSVQEQKVMKNRTISFSPSVIAGSVLEYNLLSGLLISFNSKYVSRQYIDNTQSPDRMLNAYLVHNLTFLYTVKTGLFRELTCQFAINNLFNAKYETNAWVYKYYEGGSLNMMDGYFPQAGVNYIFRLGLKF